MPTMRRSLNIEAPFGGLMYENKPGFNPYYMSKAYNVYFDRNGYIEKRPGISLEDMSPSALGTVAVNGIFEYVKQGTSGSPTKEKIIHCGGSVYSLSGSDILANETALKSGMGIGAYISHAVLSDKYYCADGSTVLQEYDGTTWADITTPPASGLTGTFAPACIAVHRWSLWGAGVPGNPSRLFKSDPQNGGDFNDNLTAFNVTDGYALVGASQIDVRPGDGTHITEIIGDYFGQLIVGKENSIHRLLGATKADFMLPPEGVIDGIGIIRGSAVRANNDLYFASTKGIHKLSTVQEYGDNKEAFLSHSIQDYFDTLDKTNMNSWCRSIHYPDLSCILWAMPTKNADTNDTILAYFYAVPPKGVWAIWTGHNISSFGLCTYNGSPSVYMGDNSRRLLRLAPDMRNDFGTAFTMEAEFVINTDEKKIWKGWRDAFVTFSPTGGSISVKHKVDNESWSDTHTITSNEKTEAADEIRAETEKMVVDRSGHIYTMNLQNAEMEDTVEIYSIGVTYMPQAVKGRAVPTTTITMPIDILYIKTAMYWGKDENNSWRMYNNASDDVVYQRKESASWTEKFAVESNTAAVLGSATVSFNDVHNSNIFINSGGCIYLFATGGDETTNGCYRITWHEGVVYWHERISGVWTLIFDTNDVTADPSVPVAISGYTEPADPTILEADNLYLPLNGAMYLYPSGNSQVTDDCIKISRNIQDLSIFKRLSGGWSDTFTFTKK